MLAALSDALSGALLLDLHPFDAVRVNRHLSFLTVQGQTFWFHCLLPIGTHPADDRRALRRRLGEFAHLGIATPAQLARACGLSTRTVYRARKRWAAEGEAGFYRPRKPRPRTAVTAEIKSIAERALALGRSLRAAARQAGLHVETLRQNLLAGVIRPPDPQQPAAEPAGADREQLDRDKPMGRATRDIAGRVAASLGALAGRRPRFEAVRNIACGGVLAALPALLQAGLLRHAGLLPALAKGFYSRAAVLLLAAMLLLARVRSFEGLRRQSPGEWGALLGLDRCPEVKTMRQLVRQLAADPQAVRAYGSALAADWLAGAGGGLLSVDGHVKVYTGKGRLPRHFVARLKLSRPAAAAYWIHAAGGQPLLCVPLQVDPGLVQAVESEVLPELDAAGLERRRSDLTAGGGEPDVTLVFDREGWSPEQFLRLAREGVACITWRKGAAGPDWPASEFELFREVPLSTPGGERLVDLRLAERAVVELPAAPGSGEPALELREIRLLTAEGRQLALVTTHPDLPREAVAAALKSRWSQENFFKYARAEFGLDSLPEHLLEPVDPETEVRNPAWSELDRDLNRVRGKRATRRDQEARADRKARALRQESRRAKGKAAARLAERADKWRAKARKYREEAAALDAAAAVLAERRRNTPKRIKVGEMEEGRRYEALPEPLRQLALNLKMIAYRAETEMLALGRKGREGKPLPRTALQALFRTPAHLEPDPGRGVLRVRILRQSSAAADRRLEPLLEELNASRTVYPGTDLRLLYELAG